MKPETLKQKVLFLYDLFLLLRAGRLQN